MAAEESLNKASVKLLIGLLKIIPMLLAICEAFNSVLYFTGIEAPALSFIGGSSFIPLLFIYIASFVFKFCLYHRMFIYYVVIIHLLNIYDYTIGLPISNTNLLSLHILITFAFLSAVLYLYLKHKLCYRQSNSYC